MGFACPVCEIPQQDATHLANHLAFTAMVHGDEHEAWLDEHVDDWSAHGEAELAPKVAELAAEADYDQVFEDTAHTHDHAEHGHRDQQEAIGGERPAGIDPEAAAATGSGRLDEETRSVLEEARAMTAEMLASDAAGRDEGASADEGTERTNDADEAGDDAADCDAE
ncbi:DUF5810 domain-containing protein [Halobellus litoreus]|uniref:DUF5810 domain-containing protein n=1 Tax=Halobellus litoreus TaxID=755310 RepID=A0ABD6DTG3_9EURY|nr:DUF5810 domain-containing protein [Halobellus litoreus]